MLDLKALRYFIAAFEEQSITRAAVKCSIAQPSITLAIQNLEDEMKCRLFVRSRTGLVPTLDGQRLYPLAQNLLRQAQSITQEFNTYTLKEVLLYWQPDIHSETVGPLIDILTAEFPQASLRITLNRDEADLRLIESSCKTKSDWFYPLWSEGYVALLPLQNSLKAKSFIEVEDLDGAPLIERTSCILHKKFRKIMQKSEIKPDLRATAPQEETVLKLVEMGIGIALVPKSHARFAPRALARPLRSQGIERQVGLSCPVTNFELRSLIKKIGPALRRN